MEKTSDKPSLLHDLNSPNKNNVFSTKQFVTYLVVVVISGVIIGFVLAQFSKTPGKTTNNDSKSGSSQKTVGIADKKTFKDKAEGTLKEGGADGEGNFHLDRPGGESQNVYLTSSTVDLSPYVGKKVRVWGQTFQADKAGWLMDVGLVEVLQ